MSKFRKRFLIIFSSVVAVIVIALVVQAQFNPYWGSLMLSFRAEPVAAETTLTRAQALSDLQFLYDAVKKDHPLFMESVPESFQQQYETECEQLSGEVTVLQVEQAARRICSTLYDGHTSVWGEYQTRYLLSTKEHNDADETLIKINGETLDELFERNKSLFSYELDSYGKRMLNNRLSSVDGLALIGIDVADGVTMTYENADGEINEYEYTDADYVTYDQYISYYGDSMTSDESVTSEFVSYQLDEGRSLAILTLNECECNDTYLSVINDMFTQIKALGIKNVAVDLRSNGGGNSMVANEFIRYLNVDTYSQGTYWQRLGSFTMQYDDTLTVNDKHEELLFEGKVFVLTSTQTFSSAMLFAQYICDNELGTIIGETAGNMPKSYGEIASFQMPNSKLFFCVSTKQFNRVDTSKADLPLTPDIECDQDDALDCLYENLA